MATTPSAQSTVSHSVTRVPVHTPRGAAALASFRFEALPSDVFDAIVACLFGDDLVRLSYVNRKLCFEQLNNADLWDARLQSSSECTARCNEPVVAAKRRYMRETSFLFRGLPTNTSDANARGACVPVPTFFRRENRFRRSPRQNAQLLNHPFTMDLWFSVLPSDELTYDGGVLVGSQSVPASATDRWADNHQQFVYMDTNRTLYCSVLGHDEVIAESLHPEQWYHLALTFDGGEQTVFLDGVVKHQTRGSVDHEWRYLHYTQLGSGCFSGASSAKPTPDFFGWYAFRGLIDEFRVWNRALERHEVERLVRGLAIKIQPVYSLRGAHDIELVGPVERVHCSRPRERRCVVRNAPLA